MKNVIWRSKLDKKYDCIVVGTKNIYMGTLKVFDGKKQLYSKDVPLAYGALFGPDVADVDAWQRTCSEFVDSLNAKKAKENKKPS